LKNLDIGFNKITSLKDNFYNNVLSLENFSLPNNKVIYLSENIKKLVNLKELNISSIFESREEEEKKSEERSEGTLN
jgi:Leucine-rich repeat (LRR) protein